jgi:Tfp pilus assembly protein PilX
MMRTRSDAWASRRPGGQRGITLVTALIMLVLLTLMAITAFHIGTSQTIIVSNAQHREEATDAAQQAIDKVLDSANFMTNPAAAIPSGNCTGGAANTWCVDVNGDGKPDVTVALTPDPKCIEGWNLNNSTLDLAKPDDLACSTGQTQTFGIEGSTSTNSLCAQSGWEVAAAATDSATNTKVTIVQGVASRIAATDLANNCK